MGSLQVQGLGEEQAGELVLKSETRSRVLAKSRPESWFCSWRPGPGSWRRAGRQAGSEVGDQVQGLGDEQDGELVPKLESLEDQLLKWVVLN